MNYYPNLGAAPSCRQDPFGQDDPFGRAKEENSPPAQQESDVVGITHTTLTRIMTQLKPDELLALYCFYANTTKRQKTQRVYCTTGFVANGLKWKEEKVRRVKKRLIELGLIEDFRPRDRKGKIGKPYILVRYVAKPSTPPQNPEGGFGGGEMLTDSKRNAVDRRSKESEETSPVGDAVILPDWRPDNRTKEQKLSSLPKRDPRKYPSERQFDQFLMDNELDEIVNKRPYLYSELSDRKWHHWSEDHQKWAPIRNWQEYVTALNRKIQEVF